MMNLTCNNNSYPFSGQYDCIPCSDMVANCQYLHQQNVFFGNYPQGYVQYAQPLTQVSAPGYVSNPYLIDTPVYQDVQGQRVLSAIVKVGNGIYYNRFHKKTARFDFTINLSKIGNGRVTDAYIFFLKKDGTEEKHPLKLGDNSCDLMLDDYCFPYLNARIEAKMYFTSFRYCEFKVNINHTFPYM